MDATVRFTNQRVTLDVASRELRNPQRFGFQPLLNINHSLGREYRCRRFKSLTIH